MVSVYSNWYRQKHKKWQNTLIASSLSECNLSELDRQIEEDESLRFLKAPSKDLPERYLYLLTEIFPEALEYSLYDLIKMSIGYKNTYSYFSKSGDKITGWCAYQTGFDMHSKKEVVKEIKMFSFDINKPNPVLMGDLQTLIEKLLDQYGYVSWQAVKENPANRIYESVLKRYSDKGFETERHEAEDGTFIYVINK